MDSLPFDDKTFTEFQKKSKAVEENLGLYPWKEAGEALLEAEPSLAALADMFEISRAAMKKIVEGRMLLPNNKFRTAKEKLGVDYESLLDKEKLQKYTSILKEARSIVADIAKKEIEKRNSYINRVCSELGITQEELARKICFSLQSIRRWSSKDEVPDNARCAIELLLENEKLRKRLTSIKTSIASFATLLELAGKPDG